MSDNDRARSDLGRLGVSPAVVLRLARYADEEGLTLRQYALFILSDYAPPLELSPTESGYEQE